MMISVQGDGGPGPVYIRDQVNIHKLTLVPIG